LQEHIIYSQVHDESTQMVSAEISRPTEWRFQWRFCNSPLWVHYSV